MEKHRIKKTAALVLAAIVLYSGVLQQEAEASNTTSPSIAIHQPVADQAKQYIDELAKQPSFDNWKGAALDISPLGPGMHSWLVIVERSGESIGYLVINATEDGGYKLGEYGIGSSPLFNTQALDFSLNQLNMTHNNKSIETLYSHPLLTAWKITGNGQTSIADGASGEILPISAAAWAIAAEAYTNKESAFIAGSQQKLLKSVRLASFAPYGLMPWLTDKPMKLSNDNHQLLLSYIDRKKQLRYTAELFSDPLLYVWSVVGYSKWNANQVYVALEADDDGSNRRYIPLQLLLEYGQFYR